MRVSAFVHYLKTKINKKEKMSFNDGTIVSRAAFAALTVVFLLAFSIFYSVIYEDLNYSSNAGLVKANTNGAVSEKMNGIDMPGEAYFSVKYTFLGSVNVGSVLGSHSFGTFNDFAAYHENEYFSEGIISLTKHDDMTVAVCANVFSDRKENIHSVDTLHGEWYKAPTELASILKTMEIDVLSTENKYTAAYGEAGYSETKNALSAKGVICAESGKTIVKKHDLISAATLFISLDKKSDLSEFCSDISRATKENDVVFVCVSYTETGERYDVGGKLTDVFRSFIDAGASLAAGTNFKSVKPCEKYNGGYIAYSLGALTDSSTKYPEKYAIALSVTVKKGESGKADTKVTPILIETYSDGEPWHPSISAYEIKNELFFDFTENE